YLFGYRFQDSKGAVLRAFGNLRDDRGKPLWLTWEAPRARSEDERDESDENIPAAPAFPIVGYTPSTGAMRKLGNLPVEVGELPLWLVHDALELTRCFACGGSNTITSLRADAEAAQTVVADAFYRSLPTSSRPRAQGYPGRGRKLLAFADSRQSAAYFAPY